jgi:hypothetical protein
MYIDYHEINDLRITLIFHCLLSSVNTEDLSWITSSERPPQKESQQLSGISFGFRGKAEAVKSGVQI